jgi:hypothetical protein
MRIKAVGYFMTVGKILLIKEVRVYINSQTLVCCAARIDQRDPTLLRTVVLIVKVSRRRILLQGA